MMRKDAALRRLQAVSKEINREIASELSGSSHIAHGLSREGYKGGYLDALADVTLLLNDVEPNRREWWWKTRRGVKP